MLDSLLFFMTFLICLKCRAHNGQDAANHTERSACPYKACLCERFDAIQARRRRQILATQRCRELVAHVPPMNPNGEAAAPSTSAQCADDLSTKRTRGNAKTADGCTSPLPSTQRNNNVDGPVKRAREDVMIDVRTHHFTNWTQFRIYRK
jgi:hypothetical protein